MCSKSSLRATQNVSVDQVKDEDQDKKPGPP